jgi:hypothetical protein
MRSCEHGNEPSGSVEGGECLLCPACRQLVHANCCAKCPDVPFVCSSAGRKPSSQR